MAVATICEHMASECNVRLNDELTGSTSFSSRLPQYFNTAMFTGARHSTRNRTLIIENRGGGARTQIKVCMDMCVCMYVCVCECVCMCVCVNMCECDKNVVHNANIEMKTRSLGESLRTIRTHNTRKKDRVCMGVSICVCVYVCMCVWSV